MPSSRKTHQAGTNHPYAVSPMHSLQREGGLSGTEGWSQRCGQGSELEGGQVKATAGPSGPAAVRGSSLGSPGFPWTGSPKGQRPKVGGGRAHRSPGGLAQPGATCSPPCQEEGQALGNWPWGPCRLGRLGHGGVCLTPTCSPPRRLAFPGVRPGGLGPRWMSAGRAPGPCQATSSKRTQCRTNLSPGIFPHKTRLPGKQPV